MRLVGIDPDLRGGFAVVEPDAHKIIYLGRIPVYEPPVKGKRRLDAPALLALLKAAVRSGATFVCMETAIVRPQTTTKGMALTAGIDTTHQTYGGIRALAEGVFGRGRVLAVHPTSWKSAMGLTRDKGLSSELAAELYPSHAGVFKVKKNDGLAEAVLLATHGKHKCT